MSQPNILLIMADQLTAKALRAYGNTVTRTPNLDRLAAQGTVFENAYCSYPLCAPARFSMMSGRLPSRIGAYDNAAEFPAAIPTFAHYLRGSGYYTCLSGKMHFVGPDQHHGFEDRLTTEIYPADFSWTPVTYDELAAANDDPGATMQGVSSVETVADAGPVARSQQIDYDEEVAQRAVQQLFDWKRYGDGRPFHMTVSFTQPHDPYVAEGKYWDLYTDAEIDMPCSPRMNVEDMDEHSQGLFYHYGLDKFEVTEAIYRKARHGYYAMISCIDDYIGRILDALRVTGMSENTVILITSDHGDMVGERGLWFKKNLFDPAMKIPLIYYRPGHDGLPRVQAPVSLVDVLPTLVDLAEGNLHSIITPVDGESLLKLMSEDRPERTVYAEHLDGGTLGPRVMVRKGALKLVYSENYTTQLFDLSSDPNELQNLADSPDYAERLKELKDLALTQWNLPQLRQDVMQSQRSRQMLAKALSAGKIRDWEHYPNAVRDHTRFVRKGDYFPTVEQKAYLFYPYSD